MATVWDSMNCKISHLKKLMLLKILAASSSYNYKERQLVMNSFNWEFQISGLNVAYYWSSKATISRIVLLMLIGWFQLFFSCRHTIVVLISVIKRACWIFVVNPVRLVTCLQSEFQSGETKAQKLQAENCLFRTVGIFPWPVEPMDSLHQIHIHPKTSQFLAGLSSPKLEL